MIPEFIIHLIHTYNLINYKFPYTTANTVAHLIRKYKNLHPLMNYDGSESLLHIVGTVPFKTRNTNVFNSNVEVILYPDFPIRAPMVFVKRRQEMYVPERISFPFLEEWEILEEMERICRETILEEIMTDFIHYVPALNFSPPIASIDEGGDGVGETSNELTKNDIVEEALRHNEDLLQEHVRIIADVLKQSLDGNNEKTRNYMEAEIPQEQMKLKADNLIENVKTRSNSEVSEEIKQKKSVKKLLKKLKLKMF